jgi:hypothetical protein
MALHTINLYTLYAHLLEKLNAIVVAIGVGIYHTLDACLDDELGTLDAWRGGDI